MSICVDARWLVHMRGKTKTRNIQARNTRNASYFAPELGRVQPVILFIIVALNINRKNIAAGKHIFSEADRC